MNSITLAIQTPSNIRYLYHSVLVDGADNICFTEEPPDLITEDRITTRYKVTTINGIKKVAPGIRISKEKLPSELVLLEVNKLINKNNTPAVQILRTILETNLLKNPNVAEVANLVVTNFNKILDATRGSYDAALAAAGMPPDTIQTIKEDWLLIIKIMIAVYAADNTAIQVVKDIIIQAATKNQNTESLVENVAKISVNDKVATAVASAIENAAVKVTGGFNRVSNKRRPRSFRKRRSVRRR
jgi:hypothetical protein